MIVVEPWRRAAARTLSVREREHEREVALAVVRGDWCMSGVCGMSMLREGDVWHPPVAHVRASNARDAQSDL